MIGDDNFDDIVRQFFGNSANINGSRKNQIIEGESDERMIDFVETDTEAFLIFEMSGYRKEDVRVELTKTEIEVIARRKVGESVVEYLAQKLSAGMEIRKPLPKFLSKKKMDWTLNNGILECKFKK